MSNSRDRQERGRPSWAIAAGGGPFCANPVASHRRRCAFLNPELDARSRRREPVDSYSWADGVHFPAFSPTGRSKFRGSRPVIAKRPVRSAVHPHAKLPHEMIDSHRTEADRSWKYIPAGARIPFGLRRGAVSDQFPNTAPMRLQYGAQLVGRRIASANCGLTQLLGKMGLAEERKSIARRIANMSIDGSKAV